MVNNLNTMSQTLWPQDESIQSYLFRALRINGFREFSTILVPNMGWGANPSLPIEAKNILLSANGSHLLKIFEKSIAVPKNESDFASHFDYIEVFKEAFFPNKRRKSAGKGIPILFCPECFKEQIYKYGFSYFKSCWLYQKYCNLHAVSLLGLKPSTISKTVKNIEDILRCKLDSTCTFNPTSIESTCVLTERSTKFAPCAKKELKNWISTTSAYYPERFVELFDYGLRDSNARSFSNSRNYKNTVNVLWELYYQKQAEGKHEKLMEFIQNKMIFDFVNFEQRDITSTPKTLLKCRDRNCNKCMIDSFEDYINCPKNKLIYFSSIPLFYINKGINYCDRLSEDLDIDVEKYQNLLGVREGEAKVKREIQKNKVYKRHGGKEKYEMYLRDIVVNLNFFDKN